MAIIMRMILPIMRMIVAIVMVAASILFPWFWKSYQFEPGSARRDPIQRGQVRDVP